MEQNFIKEFEKIKSVAATLLCEIDTYSDSPVTLTLAQKVFLKNAAELVWETTGDKILKNRKNLENASPSLIKNLCKTLITIIDKCLANPQDFSKYFEIDHNYVLHGLKKVLSTGNFSADDTWYSSEEIHSTNDMQAVARLRPSEREESSIVSNEDVQKLQKLIAADLMKMGDQTADTLDIALGIWRQKSSGNPDNMAFITTDEILEFRGVREKLGGKGNRGGYHDHQRSNVAAQMQILDHTYVKFLEKETFKESKKSLKKLAITGETKVLIIETKYSQVDIDNSSQPFAWNIRPSSLFAKFLVGPGRETTLLSQKTLQYDVSKQIWEKRLSRHFCWQWKIGFNTGVNYTIDTVQQVLTYINKELDKDNPSKTKDRLEFALDVLQKDGIIKTWQYKNVIDHLVGKKGWVKEWLNCQLIVFPPDIVMDEYEKIHAEVIKSIPEKFIAPAHDYKSGASPSLADLCDYLHTNRIKLEQASKEIGISISSLSRIKNGLKVSEQIENKALLWFKDISG